MPSIELFGLPGAGKTTLMIEVAKNSGSSFAVASEKSSELVTEAFRPRKLVRGLMVALFSITHPKFVGFALTSVRNLPTADSATARSFLLSSFARRQALSLLRGSVLTVESEGLVQRLLSISTRLEQPDREGFVRTYIRHAPLPGLLFLVHPDPQLAQERLLSRKQNAPERRDSFAPEVWTQSLNLAIAELAEQGHQVVEIDGDLEPAVNREKILRSAERFFGRSVH